ncbi:MAG: metal-sensitive transcriptional regulator [Fusobacteriaceae bacterium]|nr:metal-sensitive transcriptional regulator [Fusobacteriaceae bacterium]MBP6322632.1 metal-sensitive transcriptional regulator [Fusobacteriaceae bacterium]MBP9509733.1 metal-sensitive transcriptional regulator [Fusobacteriaceae bacterium]
MGKCIDNSAVIKRLKRVEGQIRGIIKMIEEDKPCEDILIQIGASKAALHKTGQSILEEHLHHCVLDELKNGDEEVVMKKLISALNQFSKTL